jgi:hypothetical protein
MCAGKYSLQRCFLSSPWVILKSKGWYYMSVTGRYVPVGVVFPEVRSDLTTFLTLLRTLSRTDVVFSCAKINHILSNDSTMTHVEKQTFFVNGYLTPGEADRIEKYARAHREVPAVVFRGALLEVIRWAVLVCQDKPSDGTTFENPAVRRTFAAAVLIASDLWGERVYGSALALDDGIHAARERSVGPFRNAIEGARVAPVLAHSLGRGWTLFASMLPQEEPLFLERFEVAAGMNIREYYACASAMVTNYLRPGSAATIFDANTFGGTTRKPDSLQRFLALESQTLCELRHALWGATEEATILGQAPPLYEYRRLREKPLFRATDGRTICSDPVFMGDKLSIGPFFHALPLYVQEDQTNRFFASFGRVFERYIQQLLRRIFPATPSLFDLLTFNITFKSGHNDACEIDACLNYVTEVFLFEIKATWLREEDFAPENAATLLASLHQKYGISPDRDRGAAQLAKALCMIAGDAGGERAEAFSSVQRVTPVLVVHDELLSAPGFGYFVATEFLEALSKLDWGKSEHTASIAFVSPIVLTAADLEMLEVSLEHFSFREVLADYANGSPDRMISFQTFLATDAKYAKRIYASRHLAAQAMEPLTIAMEELFGQRPAGQAVQA